MQKRWVFGRGLPAIAERLAREAGVSPLIAQLLANRGIETREDAESFLWPKLTHLHPPELLPDAEKAVSRIRQAVEARQPITIYSDYDVDGTTGAAVLIKCFELISYPVDCYIPHRVEEGYGLNMDAVREIADKGTRLVITVDCGTRSHEPISFLQQRGVDVIVTDHHLSEDRPSAFAVINPAVAGSAYPFPSLAGSGVAFKLAWALSQSFSNQKKVSPEFRKYLMTSLGYVALGTVADVVPLVGENRILARFGLTSLRESESPGIKALCEMAGLQNRRLRSEDVSFRIAPRLNAAGRMGHARETLELLTTYDPQRAQVLSEALDAQNEERKKLVESLFQAACEKVQAEELAAKPIIVLAERGWHGGVIGIVAARIVETFHRPCVILSVAEDIAKGSARTVPGYHITQAIGTCADLLISHGGHAQAAGVQMATQRIPEFRARLEEHAGRTLKEDDFLPAVTVDAEVLLAQLSPSLVAEVQSLEPFGEGNPEPVLVATDLNVAGVPRIIGKSGTHISFFVRQGEVSLRAIAFGQAETLKDRLQSGVRCSLAFTPMVNEFRGQTSVELRVKDVRIEGLKD